MLPRKPKVYLTGGEGIGWALDEDLRLTKLALKDIAEFTDLKHAEIVHTVWWEGLADLPSAELHEKRVICYMQNDLFRHELPNPRFRHMRSLVGLWVTRGNQGYEQHSSLGIASQLVPYTIDTSIFRTLDRDDSEVIALKRKWKIPENKYLIGSFQRDSEGRNLHTPKLHKGPDAFLEIVTAVAARGHSIHVLLAGPRRHWLRSQLQDLRIPFTFVGELIENDDIAVNTLPREKLNLLYNLSDLYIVASRYEGGPQAVLEAAAAGCKIISTPVGLAEDVLEPPCIFTAPTEAVELVEADIARNVLAASVQPHYQRIQAHHTPEAVEEALRRIYANWEAIPKCQSQLSLRPRRYEAGSRLVRRLLPRRPKPHLKVGLIHNSGVITDAAHAQFWEMLQSSLGKRQVDVIENRLSADVDVFLLGSSELAPDEIQSAIGQRQFRLVHFFDDYLNMDAETSLEKIDRFCSINTRFASATVLSSVWCYQRLVKLGFQPVNPVIIPQAVDPNVFHPTEQKSLDNRKIRLIAIDQRNICSHNASVYQWIERHLDWDRFEYTIVGSSPSNCDHFCRVLVTSPVEFAELLRQHDIFVIATQNDSCSLELIQALSSGLPALYLNSGGHSELVGFGGLPFSEVNEIVPKLDTFAKNYTFFRNLIKVVTIEQVTDKYVALLRDVARHDC